MILGILLVLIDHVDYVVVSSTVFSVTQFVDHVVDVVVHKAVNPVTFKDSDPYPNILANCLVALVA